MVPSSSRLLDNLTRTTAQQNELSGPFLRLNRNGKALKESTFRVDFVGTDGRFGAEQLSCFRQIDEDNGPSK